MLLKQYLKNQFEEITPWQTSEPSYAFNPLFDSTYEPKPNTKSKQRKSTLLPKM